MSRVISLQACADEPLARVGGKAAGLGRLLALGLPVPDGVCVTTDASQTLDDALRAEIERAVHPLLDDGGALAVRSSATAEDLPDHSFAGQHDTVLDIRDIDGCIDAVQRCWASLAGERAVAYRTRHGIPHDGVAMAVVIQRMVPADVAGVLFSVDPTTGRDDRIVIEAVAGLGEALVSGQVTPDRLVLSRPDLEVIAREPADLGGAVVLADEYALELGRIALQLEPAWDGAVDVEWAVADGTIAVLQARRVTAVAAPMPASLADRPPESEWEARQVWSNVNTGEVAPDVVTPMSWGLLEPLATKLVGQFFELAGVELEGQRILGLVGGRVYFNLNTVIGILRRLPGMKDKDVLQLFGGEEEPPPELQDLEIPEEDIPQPRSSTLGMLLQLPGLLWDLLTFTRGGARRVAERLGQEADATVALDIPSLDDEALARTIHETIDTASNDREAFRAVGLATMIPTALYQLCGKWFGDEGNATASKLLGGLGETETAEAGLDLWRLAAQAAEHEELAAAIAGGDPFEVLWPRLPSLAGGDAFADGWLAFLTRHGHHARGELELANPRWSEQPDVLLDQLRSYLDGLEHRDLLAHHRQITRRREETAEACRRALRNPVKRVLFDMVQKGAQRSAPYREILKSHVVRKLGVVRPMLLEAGRRMVARGTLDDPEDVFYLQLDELDGALLGEADDPRPTLATRRAEREYYMTLTPPPALRGRFDPARHRWGDPADPEDGVLTGTPVNPGLVVGTARVILRAGEDRVRPGEILVAPFTDPGWTPYFLNASAIVMDLGGVLSHGSIIARELGIPAVVNVDRATRRITTGQRLEVDGTKGTVRVLDGED